MNKIISNLVLIFLLGCINPSGTNGNKQEIYMNAFSEFDKKFNENNDKILPTLDQIERLELELGISLPDNFKTFMMSFGNIWTPDIINIIVDNELDLFDIQQFWTVDEIIYDKRNEWTSKISTDLVPFASDSMGNIFAFKSNELNNKSVSAAIYFYDHDFETIEKNADSFVDWILHYNEIKTTGGNKPQ